MVSSLSDVVAVDASLTIRRLVDGPFQDQTRALWRRWSAAGVRRVAPSLLASELASGLLRYARAGTLSFAQGQTALDLVLQIVEVQPHDALLAARAFEIARLVGATKVYDSLYAALAEREGCELWTGDERFYHAAHARFVWVRWVGEVVP